MLRPASAERAGDGGDHAGHVLVAAPPACGRAGGVDRVVVDQHDALLAAEPTSVPADAVLAALHGDEVHVVAGHGLDDSRTSTPALGGELRGR